MNVRNFYRELAPLEHVLDLAEPSRYVDVPDDWYVLITDVIQSTEAIARGQYKAVNLVGASCIIAVLNALPKAEIPFIFGGDGASILVSPEWLPIARDALLGVQALAATSFGLDLRVGSVPVATVRQHRPLKVAKFRVSPTFCQASCIGGGMTLAADLVKQDATYQIWGAEADYTADLTGLECRWQEVLSPHGHVVSLIVTSLSGSIDPQEQVYRDVLLAIQDIYGDADRYHPIAEEALRLSFDLHQLQGEVCLRSPAQSLDRWRYRCQVLVQNLLGWIFMGLGLTVGGVRWGCYKREVRQASDYQKIDDALRMVISGTSAQTQQLIHYLERRSQANHLAYGLHVSDRAVLTCLILDRKNRHFHLIDGAEGGYAIAARDLKRQLHHKARNWTAYAQLARRRGQPILNSPCPREGQDPPK